MKLIAGSLKLTTFQLDLREKDTKSEIKDTTNTTEI